MSAPKTWDDVNGTAHLTRAGLYRPPAADFAAFMALAFPWLHEAGADWKNLKAAWDAGWKAGRNAG